MNCKENTANATNHKTATGIFLLVILLVCSAFLSGCGPKQIEKTRLVVGKDSLKMYVKDLDAIKSVQYEKVDKVYKILGMEMGLSPSDPGYRGIIHLSEETGKEMFENSQWEVDSSPLPTFVNIDTSPLNSDTWYVNTDRDFSFFDPAMCNLKRFRFNGKDTIIFDIQTF